LLASAKGAIAVIAIVATALRQKIVMALFFVEIALTDFSTMDR
jgi:hypothetical protein